MDITTENLDDMNAVLRIKIEKKDYDARVDEVLKDYKKKIKMDGFRPGKVPQGLVDRLYKKPVMVEEINKIVSESISEYLKKENIRILGDPLPSEENQKEIDWDNQTEFEFEFDLGLAPDLDIQLSKKDKVPRYEIQVDDKMIKQTIDNYCRRLGKYIPADSINGNEIIKGKIVQVDNEGQVIKEGISNEESTLSVELIKDEDIKKQFLDRKVEDHIVFDVKKAFPNDQEVASILGIDKHTVPEIASIFELTIKEISRFEKAEINQELYDRIYGEGLIKTEEEFNEKIIEEIKNNLTYESNYRFSLDAKNMLLTKVKFDLPVEFLKRWLVVVNGDKYTKEQIEKDFPKFEDDLKWQLIKDHIIKTRELKVTDDEFNAYVRTYVLSQFRQYGIVDVPDNYLEKQTNQILKDNDEVKRIYEKLFENKVNKYLLENLNVDNKKITFEKFNKLYEK